MYEKLERTVVRMTGNDRSTFLNNFCTADLKLLSPGEITEAFILNVKGKIAAHVLLICGEDYLELNTVEGQGAAIIEHLDRYLIREDVEMADESASQSHMFVFDQKLEGDFPDWNQHMEMGNGRVAHCEVAGEGYLFSSPSGKPIELESNSIETQRAPAGKLDSWRVLFGTPWYGVDFTDENLPQELQRDDKAISFEKGCYLGQETVARIDALGRVNKLLVKVRSKSELTAGDELFQEDKVVGKVTSVAFQHDQWFGLTIVRRGASSEGMELQTAAGVKVEVWH